MNRRVTRILLVSILIILSGFAAWSWLRPYEWNADPKARCRIHGTQVRADHGYIWVDVHLKILPGQTHDLAKPVILDCGHRQLEPADTTIGSKDDTTTDLWFKFWLDPTDIQGPLILRINDGKLIVKAEPGMPLKSDESLRYFPTNRW